MGEWWAWRISRITPAQRSRPSPPTTRFTCCTGSHIAQPSFLRPDHMCAATHMCLIFMLLSHVHYQITSALPRSLSSRVCALDTFSEWIALKFANELDFIYSTVQVMSLLSYCTYSYTHLHACFMFPRQWGFGRFLQMDKAWQLWLPSIFWKIFL